MNKLLYKLQSKVCESDYNNNPLRKTQANEK